MFRHHDIFDKLLNDLTHKGTLESEGDYNYFLCHNFSKVETLIRPLKAFDLGESIDSRVVLKFSLNEDFLDQGFDFVCLKCLSCFLI